MKCCPECGSTNVTYRFGGRAAWLWICKKCGWHGYGVVDFPDETLKKMKEIEKAEKIEKKMKRRFRRRKYY